MLRNVYFPQLEIFYAEQKSLHNQLILPDGVSSPKIKNIYIS